MNNAQFVVIRLVPYVFWGAYVLLSHTSVLVFAAEERINKIVKEHSQNEFTTINVTVHNYERFLPSEKQHLTYVGTWRSDGKNQYVRLHQVGKLELNGIFTEQDLVIYEWQITDEKIYQIGNVPSSYLGKTIVPLSEQVGRARGVRGTIVPLSVSPKQNLVASWLLLKPGLGESLEYLCSQPENVIAVTDSNPNDLFMTILDKKRGFKLALHFDAKHSYWIDTLSCQEVGSPNSVAHSRVKEWQRLPNGRHFPKTVLTTTGNLEILRTVENVRVNEPIDLSEMSVRFPPGARISELRPNDNNWLLHIWGEKGPEKTLHNMDELREWESHYFKRRQTSPEPPKSPNGSIGPWFWVVNVFLLLIVIVLYLARTKANKANK